MTHLPRPETSSIVHGEKEDEPVVNGFTRRGVLAGAAVATAAASIGAIDAPANAQTPEEMIVFVQLSAALTGIAAEKLAAPNFSATVRNSDPVDIKRDYFAWVNQRHPALLRRLLQIARDSQKPPAADPAKAIIDKVQAAPDTKYLARSIVLMWYLGAWYDPNHLQELERPNPPPLKFKVISSKAYTQGWVWRVAQAHPMGFSEMQFGYWARPPSPLRPDFIGN
jgi:Membrane bound FAD containing D-sorbitol dehydrogenase